jgi:hypothetical protein
MRGILPDGAALARSKIACLCESEMTGTGTNLCPEFLAVFAG